jgi:hypothetical protein
MFVSSLRAVGEKMGHDQDLASVRAVGGVTSLISLNGNSSGAAVFQHLGFTVSPYHHPLGRFGVLWDNLTDGG